MGSGFLWRIQMRMSRSTISSISLSLFLAVQTDCPLHVRFLYAAPLIRHGVGLRHD